MAKQYFLLANESGFLENIGEREVPEYSDLGAGARPINGYALFCPICGDIWGKIGVTGKHRHYMQPLSSSCINHAVFPSDATFTSHYGFNHPDDPRGYDPETFPMEVLRHDVFALCTFYLNNPDKIFLLHFAS